MSSVVHKRDQMLTIDGSIGEGGGQILRTALGLSLVTGQPFRIVRIRAGRAKPGLMRQHLTAVNAAAQVGQVEVSGAVVGSQDLTFRPGRIAAGFYSFAVGTAGSATLVLQTVLPALLTAASPSALTLEGGTHNPQAPPFDFLVRAFLPLMNRMGPHVQATLVRAGFYPAGGGQIDVTVRPSATLSGFDLLARGEIRARRAHALIASLPHHIAERELRLVGNKMGWDASCLHVEIVEGSRGPGNAVTIEIECEHVTELFTGFGERGLPAEAVGRQGSKGRVRLSRRRRGRCRAPRRSVARAAGAGRRRLVRYTRTHAAHDHERRDHTEISRRGDPYQGARPLRVARRGPARLTSIARILVRRWKF